MHDASDVGDSSLEGFQLYDAGHPDILAMAGKGVGEEWWAVGVGWGVGVGGAENYACVY